MTFATEVLKPASERFMLVEMRPRYYPGAGISIGGNDYTWTLTLDAIYKVYVNDVEVAGASWSYTGGLLTVNSASSLSDAANFVILELQVFLTGSKTRDTLDGVAGLPSAVWLPYISQYPEWSQSVRDITAGVFSIANTSLSVISEDRWIQEMLTTNYSWYRSSVFVYMCVNTLDLNRLVFNGEVAKLTITGNIVNFEIADAFQKLNQTASFGTNVQAYVQEGSVFTPNVQPQDQGLAIPLVLGETSKLQTTSGYRISEAFGTPASTPMHHLINGLKCIPTTASLNTATSVVFLCGRIVGTTVRNMTFGTISDAYNHYMTKDIYSNDQKVTIAHKFIYLNCSNFTGEIGDYVPTQDAWVCAIGTFTHAATTFNVALTTVEYYFSDTTTYTSGSFGPPSIADNTYPSMSLWVTGDTPASYQLFYEPLALDPLWTIPTYSGRYIPFTLSYGTAYTIGGQSITPVYATVASADIGDDLPGKLNIHCRFSSPIVSHGEAMKFICKAAGLAVNNDSFDDANTDLDADVVITIPSGGAGTFPKYIDVAQSLAQSTLGMVTVNEDREVEYSIIPDPDAETSIGTKDESNMLDGNTAATVEYQDIYSDYVFENPNYRGIQSLNTSGPGPNTVVTKNKARYLHKSGVTKTIQHDLVDITNRKAAIAAYHAEPNITYSYSTASEDLVSEIGDVVTIENDVVADATSTKKAMIVGIDSAGSSTKITVNELRGL